jgi:hypothetical protein
LKFSFDTTGSEVHIARRENETMGNRLLEVAIDATEDEARAASDVLDSFSGLSDQDRALLGGLSILHQRLLRNRKVTGYCPTGRCPSCHTVGMYGASCSCGRTMGPIDKGSTPNEAPGCAVCGQPRYDHDRRTSQACGTFVEVPPKQAAPFIDHLSVDARQKVQDQVLGLRGEVWLPPAAATRTPVTDEVWRRPEGGNQWGHEFWSLGGARLRPGEVVRVRWPDNSETVETLATVQHHFSVGDMGHNYEGVTDRLYVATSARGVPIKVFELDALEMVLGGDT